MIFILYYITFINILLLMLVAFYIRSRLCQAVITICTYAV